MNALTNDKVAPKLVLQGGLKVTWLETLTKRGSCRRAFTEYRVLPFRVLHPLSTKKRESKCSNRNE